MALQFGGASTDKISAVDAVSIRNLSTFSIIAWVHLLTAYPAGDIYILSKSEDGTLDAKGLYITSTGAIGGRVRRATSDAEVLSAAAVCPLLKWFMVVMTYDGSTAPKLYLATEVTPSKLLTPASSAAGEGAINADATFPLIIGNIQPNTNVFIGQIGPIGLWNRVLTSFEISEKAQHLQPSSGNVLLYYLGRNNANMRQEDFSGKGNTGLMTGSLNKAPSPRFTRVVAQEQ